MHLFPLLSPLIQKSLLEYRAKWQRCLYRSLDLLKSPSPVLGHKAGNLQYHLVYGLEQYSQVWNVLLQNIKRTTKPCEYFFVVGDARCNNLFFTWKDILAHL